MSRIAVGRSSTERTLLLILGLAVSLPACGGSTSSPSTLPLPVFTPLPVLVPGSSFVYKGKFSESVTYPSESPNPPNSLGVYATLGAVRIVAAPPGASASVEVRRDLRYTVVKAPTSGVQLQSSLTDSYESSELSSDSQTISQTRMVVTTTGINQTADRIEGNGPYDYRSVVHTTYSTPRVLFIFPLVAGTTSVPLARTVATLERSANAKGDIYSSRDTTAHYADSGAYVQTGSVGVGETTRVKANPNGTGTLVNSGTTDLRITVAPPSPNPSNKYLIPVSFTVNGVQDSYLADDWYPGGAAPPSPISASTQTVKGPATIPSTCGVKVAVSNVQEVDTSSTTLDVITGSYMVGKTREFLSDGIVACRVTSSTGWAYDIKTGAIISTTVDSLVEGLTEATIPSK